MVDPGYSPVPFKVVSQITAGKFVNLEDLLAENIPISKPEPQLFFGWLLGVVAHAQKTEASDYRHHIMDGGFFHLFPHCLLLFSASVERFDKLQVVNTTNISSV